MKTICKKCKYRDKESLACAKGMMQTGAVTLCSCFEENDSLNERDICKTCQHDRKGWGCSKNYLRGGAVPECEGYEPKPSKLVKAVNVVYESVADFHKKINHPNPDRPMFFVNYNVMDQLLGKQVSALSRLLKGIAEGRPQYRRILRAAWILEEVGEYLCAETAEDQADALCDMLVFIFGTFCECGYNPGRAFDAVMAKNMQKNVSVNGEKVTKPKGWTGPEAEIKADIERQRREAFVSTCAGE